MFSILDGSVGCILTLYLSYMGSNSVKVMDVSGCKNLQTGPSGGTLKSENSGSRKFKPEKEGLRAKSVDVLCPNNILVHLSNASVKKWNRNLSTNHWLYKNNSNKINGGGKQAGSYHITPLLRKVARQGMAIPAKCGDGSARSGRTKMNGMKPGFDN